MSERTNFTSAYGLMAFALEGEAIAGIIGFPRRPELFDRFPGENVTDQSVTYEPGPCRRWELVVLL